MILELAAGGLLVADFFYHRWWGDHPKAFSNFADSIDVPQTEEGTPIGFVYGKVRITRPILAWMSTPEATPGAGTTAGKTKYSASMFFVLGMPFCGGTSTNRIHRIWQGDTVYSTSGTGTTWAGFANPPVALDQLDGNSEAEDVGRHLAFISFFTKTSDGDVTAYSAGAVEFLNGNPSQVMVDDASPYAVHNRAASRMSINEYERVLATGAGGPAALAAAEALRGEIPGYRGVMSMCLYRLDPDTGSGITVGGFTWGITPQLAPFSVECSSYKSDGGYPATGTQAQLGDDSNPINVIYDILTDPRKLGLSPSLIDLESFINAAATCYQDDLGFSTCFDARTPAREMIKEVLRHVDGVMFESQKTAKLKIKLIRPDFDYRSLFEINRSNCNELQNLAIGNMTEAPNKVDVLYKDRALGYIDAKQSYQNGANAVGQDGIERLEQIAFRGCTYAAQAASLAAREFASMIGSRIKLRAMMTRAAIDLEPGDPVRLSWNNPPISGLVFRVAGPPYHGKLGDGRVAIDLIQDYQYQYRQLAPQPPIDHPDIGHGISLGFGLR